MIQQMLTPWYDSTQQRDLLLQGGHPAILATARDLDPLVIGQLRWDALRSPDRKQMAAQLLDGSVFHSLSQGRAIEKLGVFLPYSSGSRYPFHIATIGDNLESSLRDMVSRPFLFSSVAANYWERSELQARLKGRATPELVEAYCAQDGPIDGIVGLIRDMNVLSAEECNRLGRSWKFWSKAEDDGILTTGRARPYGDDALSFQLEGWDGIELKTHAGRYVHGMIPGDLTRDENGTRRRSLVWQLLDPLYRSADADEREDADILRAQFDRCYYRTIASAEESSFSYTGDRLYTGRLKDALDNIDPHRMVIFPHDFKAHLGHMTQTQWADFTERVQIPLHQWWEDPWGNLDSFQEVGDRLRRDIADNSTLPDSGKATVFSVIASGGGGAAALSATNPLAAFAVGAITYIVTDPALYLLRKWNLRRKLEYDVMEVLPEEPNM
ncbi:hypothetical protein [Kitasatospora sp. NPDC050543]|uniref:hypothetical protein n=1 Tax=Kitasatospora sp. NPDC050543 TaxID=3364054 RepID=UPI0037A73EB7